MTNYEGDLKLTMQAFETVESPKVKLWSPTPDRLNDSHSVTYRYR